MSECLQITFEIELALLQELTIATIIVVAYLISDIFCLTN